MKKKTILIALFWLLLITFLMYKGQTAPTITDINEDRSITLCQDSAQFTVELTGRWQKIKETKETLSIYQAQEDALIDFRLEVGGFDYYSDAALAGLFGRELSAADNNLTLVDTFTDTVANGGRGRASFTMKKSGNDYRLELFIYRPVNGIRYYAAYIFPASLGEEQYEEGLAIISSMTFLDLESLYPAFL